MPAPDTNVEQQRKQHRSSLIGIKAAIVFGALMLLCVVFYTTLNGSSAERETLIGSDAVIYENGDAPVADQTPIVAPTSD